MTENPLWKYSLTVYSLPAVKEDCLKLQDEFGADVNLLLCSCWLAHCGVACEQQHWQAMREISDTFQGQYLQPARALRRKLRSVAPDDVYAAARALELSLEQWQQAVLWEYWQPRSQASSEQPFAALALHNCRGQFEHGDYRPGSSMLAALQQFVTAVEMAQGAGE